MNDGQGDATAGERPGNTSIRWWPAVGVMALTGAAVMWVGLQADWPYQQRNLTSMALVLVGACLLWLWWLWLSRAPWRWRLGICGSLAVAVGLWAGLFRIRGVSGDLLPILEPRWRVSSDVGSDPGAPRSGGPTDATEGEATASPVPVDAAARHSFPQFLGPNRDCVLDGPALEPDWGEHPPVVLWRRPVGAAWSGFATVGNRAFTQEQRGEEEAVSCYEATTGTPIWVHADVAHYRTTIAGEGPRCTPTVVSDRVYTVGATGWLNCLDAADGRRIWGRNLAQDAEAPTPEWGFAGSPLASGDKIVVSAGGRDGHSLLAYDAATGELAWTGGSAPAGYSSPVEFTLVGVPQILMFNARRITAHAPASGEVLWEYPWGVGQPHVAVPVQVASDRVVFSSGYGVGAELLELSRTESGWVASRVWKSIRLKAKFANFMARHGYLYGLDDGVLACVALADGTQAWKEGRYGHGQMVLVQELLLMMAERGELVLLRPTPEGPNELHRFRVFESKTWNPPALAGELLLVRNDKEAVGVRLALAPGGRLLR